MLYALKTLVEEPHLLRHLEVCAPECIDRTSMLVDLRSEDPRLFAHPPLHDFFLYNDRSRRIEHLFDASIFRLESLVLLSKFEKIFVALLVSLALFGFRLAVCNMS